jgi:hypothetical protein
LIAGHGRPGHYLWSSDERPGKILSKQDEEFSVSNSQYGLLELLPDPRLDRYKFRAQVRHIRADNGESRVGIYFAHGVRQQGDDVAHFHCNVTFNDLTHVGEKDENGNFKTSPVGLEVHRQDHRQPLIGVSVRRAYVSRAQDTFIPGRPGGTEGTWRDIEVEVRPEAIKVSWMGKRIATTPHRLLMTSARTLFAKPDEALPADCLQFEPRGSLGLYVSLGVASFRNVFVEPLDDEN